MNSPDSGSISGRLTANTAWKELEEKSFSKKKFQIFFLGLNQTEIRLYLPCTDWFRTASGLCLFAVPNQSVHDKYNLIRVWFTAIWKGFALRDIAGRPGHHEGSRAKWIQITAATKRLQWQHGIYHDRKKRHNGINFSTEFTTTKNKKKDKTVSILARNLPR